MSFQASVKNDMTECRGATANIAPCGEEKEACHSQATRPVYWWSIPGARRSTMADLHGLFILADGRAAFKISLH